MVATGETTPSIADNFEFASNITDKCRTFAPGGIFILQ
jgi:hypothetical protein